MRGRGALWALVAAGALLLAGCAGPGGAGKGAGPAGDETAQYLAFLRATESATPASEVRLPPAAQWPDVLARCRTGVPALLELAGELQQLEAQIASADGEPLTADANVVGPALYWAVVLSPFGHGGMTDQERDTLARRLSGLPVAGTIVLPAPAQGDLITRAATAGSRLFADGAGRLPALIERLAASPKAAQTVSGAEALLLAAAYAQSEGGGVTASAALAKAIDMDGMAACIQDLGKGGSLKPFTAPAAGRRA